MIALAKKKVFTIISCFKTKEKNNGGGGKNIYIYTIQCQVFAKLSKTLPRRKRIIDFDFANFRFGTIQQDLFQRSE